MNDYNSFNWRKIYLLKDLYLKTKYVFEWKIDFHKI